MSEQYIEIRKQLIETLKSTPYYHWSTTDKIDVFLDKYEPSLEEQRTNYYKQIALLSEMLDWHHEYLKEKNLKTDFWEWKIKKGYVKPLPVIKEMINPCSCDAYPHQTTCISNQYTPDKSLRKPEKATETQL
jgi:hypothetical protein